MLRIDTSFRTDLWLFARIPRGVHEGIVSRSNPNFVAVQAAPSEQDAESRIRRQGGAWVPGAGGAMLVVDVQCTLDDVSLMLNDHAERLTTDQ
jgi:hypothetical protein